MKKNIVIIGTIIISIGIFLFIFGSMATSNTKGNFWGYMLSKNSEAYERDIMGARLVTNIGLFLAFIGFPLMIVGLVKDGGIMNQASIEQNKDRRCPGCGRVIPFDAIICPYCERDFREVKNE